MMRDEGQASMYMYSVGAVQNKPPTDRGTVMSHAT